MSNSIRDEFGKSKAEMLSERRSSRCHRPIPTGGLCLRFWNICAEKAKTMLKQQLVAHT
jgi:hypothetical protein